LVEHLPIAVEVRQAVTAAQWQQQLADTIRWADQIAVALPWATLPPLQQTIQQQRFRLEPGFVQALVPSDLVCGFGACLACVVPTRDGGYTRACVHGPVFDLTTLV
jgi:dihydroorotate dehydrogenase electron transfer subunit